MEQSEHLLRAFRTEPVGSDEFINAVQTLAIQSRESPEIRLQLAKTIPRLLQVIEKPGDVADEVLAATLRCIGNACVDNQEACQAFVEADFDLTHLVNLLEHRRLELRDLTMKLLYNICSQSEAAQKKCFEASVHASIVSSLFEEAESDTDDSDLSPSLAIDLLFWITSQSRERDAASKSLKEGLGLSGIKKLLDLPSMLAEALDTEDFATLLEISLVFLRDQEIQDDAAKERLVGKIWRTLEINEGKVQEVEGDADDHKLLVALSTSLTWILSDVAASESFATMEDIEDSTLLACLLSFLTPSEGPPSATPIDIPNGDLRPTIAACQVIGNYLHGKDADAAVPLVKDRRIHQRLFECMVASDNADFLHSAAGLLIQLSRPSPQIRLEIASDSNAIAATERLGKHTVQQLNQDALMLMRALGKETPSVQERFKPLAGEVMASVAEAQQAATDAQAAQPSLPGIE